MQNCTKLIDPSKEALNHWLKNACFGDQCQVMTAQGDVYAHLTKLKTATARLPVTGLMGQDNFPNHKNRFMELMEILGAFSGKATD